MRKLTYSLLAALLLVAAAVVLHKTNTANQELFQANVEALTEDEGATIICSKGSCGQCFDIKVAWPFYRCIWTGYQSDYCDCDKVGWIGK